MNKIKLVADVITAMKDKEGLKGAFKAEGRKDGAVMLNVNNTFEKTMRGPHTKASFRVEAEHDGRKFKHEGSSEFDMHDFHAHLHQHHWNRGHCAGFHGHHHGHGGIKEMLAHVAMALQVFNTVNAEELEDGSVQLSLSLGDMSDEMRTRLMEGIRRRHEQGHHPFHAHHEHCSLFKEFHEAEISDFSVTLYIRKSNEIDRLLLTMAGTKKDECGSEHILELQAEVNLE